MGKKGTEALQGHQESQEIREDQGRMGSQETGGAMGSQAPQGPRVRWGFQGTTVFLV